MLMCITKLASNIRHWPCPLMWYSDPQERLSLLSNSSPFWHKCFLNSKIFFDQFFFGQKFLVIKTFEFFLVWICSTNFCLLNFLLTSWRITQLIDSGMRDYHFYSASPIDVQLGRLNKSDNLKSPHLLIV